MIKRILLAIILAIFTITLNAQGYWKLESTRLIIAVNYDT